MYVRRQRVASGQVGGFFADARKFLHKFVPRELSPTRLLEKFAVDTKKKGVAKVAAVANAAQAKQDAADAVAVQQLLDIQRAAPVVLPAALQAALPPPGAVVRRVEETNYTPYYVGGALIVGAALIWSRR